MNIQLIVIFAYVVAQRERDREFKRKKRTGCIKKYNKRKVYTKSERDGEFERKERAGCTKKYNKKKYTQKGDRGREF